MTSLRITWKVWSFSAWKRTRLHQSIDWRSLSWRRGFPSIMRDKASNIKRISKQGILLITNQRSCLRLVSTSTSSLVQNANLQRSKSLVSIRKTSMMKRKLRQSWREWGARIIKHQPNLLTTWPTRSLRDSSKGSMLTRVALKTLKNSVLIAKTKLSWCQCIKPTVMPSWCTTSTTSQMLS